MVKSDDAPMKYIGYEDIGEAYSSGEGFQAENGNDKVKFDEIAKIIGDGLLLDLACGDGAFTVPLLKRGVRIIAMDISDKMLSLLYKRAEREQVDTVNLTVCRANALDVPLIGGAVDAVIANSMLHLISKPEIVVNEIHRVLKTGGKYITFSDKPSYSAVADNELTDDEKSENARHNKMLNHIHRRYFEILKDEYGIHGTRYNWQFDREKVCGELFPSSETITVVQGGKISYLLDGSFIHRMGGKGFSDQSDVPKDIHETVFKRVMDEFYGEYGENAGTTRHTGIMNDFEIMIYTK
jgi:ubiquinone/menaquinone biosynthesis C-methylase UbiE